MATPAHDRKGPLANLRRALPVLLNADREGRRRLVKEPRQEVDRCGRLLGDLLERGRSPELGGARVRLPRPRLEEGR